MKKLLFSSLSLALCLTLISSCIRKQSKTVEENLIPPTTESINTSDVTAESKPFITADTIANPAKDKLETVPAKTAKETKSGTIERPKVVVKKPNEYNTKGPNQNKVDSIKAAKAKGKYK